MKRSVDMIETMLARNTGATSAIKFRLDEALQKQITAQKSYDEARSERQTALATGGDITKINTKLKQAQEAIELADDAVIGFNNELLKLASESSNLNTEFSFAIIEQDTEELKELAGIYNVQADQLAKTVKQIWAVRRRLKEDPLHSRVLVSKPGWGHNALENIPKLFIAGEPLPRLVTDESFFNANFM
jgi:hypothetical protein